MGKIHETCSSSFAPGTVSSRVHQCQVGRYRLADWSRQSGNPGTCGGPTTIRLTTAKFAPCHTLVAIVSTIGVTDGANDGKFVHHLRDTRKQLTDLNARHTRTDGVEFAANFSWRIRFQVPHVEVGRSTWKIDVDHGPMRTPDPSQRFHFQHLCQRQSTIRGASDLQEAASRQTITESGPFVGFSVDCQHRTVSPGPVVGGDLWHSQLARCTEHEHRPGVVP